MNRGQGSGLPSGSSRGDQILNAKAFEKAGYSYVLKDEDLSDDTLIGAIKYVDSHRLEYLDAMEASKETAAVDTICSLLNETAGRAGE